MFEKQRISKFDGRPARAYGGQDGPKTLQDGAQTGQDSARTPKDASKTRPRRPNMVPRCFQNALRCIQDRLRFGIVQILKIIENHVNFNVFLAGFGGLCNGSDGSRTPKMARKRAKMALRRRQDGPKGMLRFFGRPGGELCKFFSEPQKSQGSNKVVGLRGAIRNDQIEQRNQ